MARRGKGPVAMREVLARWAVLWLRLVLAAAFGWLALQCFESVPTYAPIDDTAGEVIMAVLGLGLLAAAIVALVWRR